MIRSALIGSSSTATDARPWIVYDIDAAAQAVVVRDVNGLAARGTVSRQKEAGLRRRIPLELRPGDEETPHWLMLTLDGQWVFEPETRLSGEYYAHVARFDPKTGDWLKLEFLDEQGERDEQRR